MQVNPSALTEIRERSGYKKSAFASLVGISPSYLTEMEKGDQARQRRRAGVRL